ncbi:hypothetical protein FSP39_007201 [Pinctada imbricata]|uniref:Uncharacterized protein n=1 Tax=Pinctada imbricata TaxID=66713 RepID=A0AA88XVX2_PINIB|nr:hypothetical protein FSP39_007201 [Pinctada imbricata]
MEDLSPAHGESLGLKKKLNSCVENLMKNSDFTILLRKLVISNGGHCIGVPFTNALVIADFLYDDSKCLKTESFTEIFLTGCKIIMGYVLRDEQPKDPMLKKCLDQLLGFISNIKASEKGLKCEGKVKESLWMTRIIVHYLAALSVLGEFQFDKYTKDKPTQCSCSCRHKVSYTDTNIGNPHTWYGKLDVVLGCFNYDRKEDSPVAVTKVADDTLQEISDEACSSFDTANDDSSGGKTQAEVKVSPFDAGLSQVQAQTIVFSFYQRKRHPEVGLVPSIAVRRTHIHRALGDSGNYFYDCHKDIYLLSKEMPLFQGKDGSLNFVTLVATWLVVNYKQLMTGATEEIEKDVKFGLMDAFSSDSLDYYKSGIEMTPFDTDNHDDFSTLIGVPTSQRDYATAKLMKSNWL